MLWYPHTILFHCVSLTWRFGTILKHYTFPVTGQCNTCTLNRCILWICTLSFHKFSRLPPRIKIYHLDPLMDGSMTWYSWLRHCATSWKVPGSIPDGAIVIFNWYNPACCTVALGLPQPVTQSMKSVTTEFKSGGLHEKHVVATWNVGNHLSICL